MGVHWQAHPGNWALLGVPFILFFLARTLCGKEARGRAWIDEAGNVQYTEVRGWIWWRVGLFFVVLPALIVLDRMLA